MMNNAYLRQFEEAMIAGGHGCFDIDGLFGAETPIEFSSAGEALKYVSRTGRIGTVPCADAFLLNALAYEQEA